MPGRSHGSQSPSQAKLTSPHYHHLPRQYLYPNAEQPSFVWRGASYQTMLAVSTLCRAFLYGLNRTQVNGLPRFLDLLKSRCDPKTRRRGLLTVSNHISVMDDPLIWGVLPLSFTAFHGYQNSRWGFGSHDICFQNTPLSLFFTLGQVLPTHRKAHSLYGGPFQTSMTEGVRLFSNISSHRPSLCPHNHPAYNSEYHTPSFPWDCIDPFSDLSPPPSYPSHPSDTRYYLQPSRYASNAYSWIHIFPEGMIHQSPPTPQNNNRSEYTMRYFKWGVARLILEPPECPDVVPMFIEGSDQVMHESRTFPRFLPRFGKDITVTFGHELDVDATFGDLRKGWRDLCQEDARANGWDEWDEITLGLVPPSLERHPEAVRLREECTKRVRDAVLAVRRSRGYADEDPKGGVAETWAKEGPQREGRMDDGSWVKDT
ncbi:uncharacterized protein A1O9_11767 [Exophiala aquamarina CBS 119918]|uniref:Tafazzin family protein n=1 Tax=Exophiala aquamarina CBS 119918 TaxID=1182545 RepID=A0A072NX18_9EURO|nr:uncharacterized protein A1O9_11767 [Exophiala aquamarina CBS 119918]KEF52141.1 hypothetical protein A1O9_11767 [Exophiala aquamarina CBS 119918]